MKCPICAIECEEHKETVSKKNVPEDLEFTYYTCPNCYGIFESKENEYE